MPPPKKKPAKKTPAKKAPAKKASAKTASTKHADPFQDAVSTVRGFQLYTLIGLGLVVLFVLFQLFPDLRYVWWLNAPAAVAGAGLLWHQSKNAKGLELQVCTYALYAIIAMFVLRDIYLADTLSDIRNWDIDNFFSQK